MSFEFFDYGEQRRFVFLQVPKLLLYDERYKNLSGDAKLLYSLMLERGDISHQNGWYDERGHPFIYFTIEDVMEKLHVGHTKAASMLNDLEKAELIARIRQGQGKPNRIYVGRFFEEETFPEEMASKSVDPDNAEIMKSGIRKSEYAKIKNTGKRKSGRPQTGHPEVRNPAANNTDYNNTKISKTESIDPVDAIDEITSYFESSCGFEELKRSYPYREKELESIRDLLVDACTTTRPTIRIMGEDKPAAVVVSRLMKLNSSHICYVMDCLKENTTKIINIRQYLLASLYNAPVTMDHYYTTLVNHDMAQGLI